MSKKKLVVVHGMGQHDDASVKKEVADTFTVAFGFYESLKGQSVADHIDIVPASYNSFFDDYRKKLYETDRDKATELLEKWRSALRLRGSAVPAQVLSELKGLSSELEKRVDALGRGEVSEPQSALDEYIPGRAIRVKRAISNWQGDIAEDLQHCRFARRNSTRGQTQRDQDAQRSLGATDQIANGYPPRILLRGNRWALGCDQCGRGGCLAHAG